MGEHDSNASPASPAAASALESFAARWRQAAESALEIGRVETQLAERIAAGDISPEKVAEVIEQIECSRELHQRALEQLIADEIAAGVEPGSSAL